MISSRSILTDIASIVTIIAFLLQTKPQAEAWWWHAFLVLAFLYFAIVLWLDARDWWRAYQKTYKPNEPKIAGYLCDWLQSGGRAVIYSRDLGWVDNQSREVLIEKSRRHELILCVPKLTSLARELQGEGAEVYSYADLGYSPKSRFTIINFDRGDARMTTGAVLRGKHVMRELDVGEDPSFWIAEDLINIIRRLPQR